MSWPPADDVAGQIVIINGTSGVGKSTTAELLVRRSERFWLLYGIDHFLASTFPAVYGHHGPRAEEGIVARPVDPADPDGPLRWELGPHGWQAFRTLHEWVAAASRQGCDIVLDHLLLTDPPLLDDCVARLSGLPVLLVTLTSPYEVLVDRVASRTMDKKLPAAEIHGDDGVRRAVERLARLRPWFYRSVYANDRCDLRVDTVEHRPDEVCALIEARLSAGPGTAFEELRAQGA